MPYVLRPFVFLFILDVSYDSMQPDDTRFDRG